MIDQIGAARAAGSCAAMALTGCASHRRTGIGANDRRRDPRALGRRCGRIQGQGQRLRWWSSVFPITSPRCKSWHRPRSEPHRRWFARLFGPSHRLIRLGENVRLAGVELAIHPANDEIAGFSAHLAFKRVDDNSGAECVLAIVATAPSARSCGSQVARVSPSSSTCRA